MPIFLLDTYKKEILKDININDDGLRQVERLKAKLVNDQWLVLKQWIRTHSDYTVRKVFDSKHPRTNTTPGSEMVVLKNDHHLFADNKTTHQLLTDALMAYDV